MAMIRHVVMLRLRDDHDPAELAAALDALGKLVGKIEGFLCFAHGPNIDAEGKSPCYPHGFLCDFADRAALDRYADDPRHRAIGVRLVDLCKGGPEGIMVYDLVTESIP